MFRFSFIPKDGKKRQQAIKYSLATGGILMITFLAYFLQAGISTSLFQANILGIGGTPKPFDGTTMPIEKTLSWVKLTSSQYTDFKSGKLGYDEATNLNMLVALPKYDTAILAKDPKTLGWSGADLDTRMTLLTYVTAYMGAYTSGSAPAIEHAGSHLAVDIRAPKGTPVKAIANGRVVKAKSTSSDGNTLVIEHVDVPSVDNPTQKTNYYSSYLHLDSFNVQVGDLVEKGQLVGKVGITGIATTYHLHFQLDKMEAPFHPFWPFTWSEASAAGFDFVTAVNAGLGKAQAVQYTVNPMTWIAQNLNTTVTPTNTNIVTNTNSEVSANLNINSLPTNTNTTLPNTNVTTIVNTNTNTLATPSNINNNSNTVSSSNVNTAVVEERNTNSYATKLTLAYSTAAKINEPVKIAVKGVDNQGKIAAIGVSDAVLISAEGGDGEFSRSLLSYADFSSGQAEITYTPKKEGSVAVVAKAGNITGTGPVLTVSEKTSDKFLDVDDNNIHTKAIYYLQKKGIIQGYSDNTFKPEQVVTRAEAVKIILAGTSIEPLTNIGGTSFPDVSTNEWFAGWVQKAKELNIVGGNPNGNFDPKSNVLGAAVMKMLLLANKIDFQDITIRENPYTDVAVTEWYASFYQYAKDKNLIDADSSGNGKPGEAMTRADVAEVMYRLLRMKEANATKYSHDLD